MKGTMPRSDGRGRGCATPVLSADRRKEPRREPDDRRSSLRNEACRPRISEPGSVEVPELFSIESYETVHQMTSLVTGQMMAGTGLGDIFPRPVSLRVDHRGPQGDGAMEILRELEPGLRVTSIAGRSAGRRRMAALREFNVAIRTRGWLRTGLVTLNVGGGLVYDSTAESEYEEALWKARFARRSDFVRPSA